jgi:hypothetical protein
MRLTEELVTERTDNNLKLAEQLRWARKLHTLRRAERMERKAERRLIEAWRRAAQLRATVEPADR